MQVTSRKDFAGGSLAAYGPGAAPAAFSPYANQCRLYAPVSASNTMIRRLPVSATNTSFAAASTAIADGRFRVVWLSGPSILPGVPICRRNLPSRENLITCASPGGGGPAGAAPRRPPAAGCSAAVGSLGPRPRAGAGSSPAAVIQTLPFASTARPPGDCGH